MQFDLTGRIHNDWTVLEYGKHDEVKQIHLWRCRCKCGFETLIRTAYISGNGKRASRCCRKCLNAYHAEERSTGELPQRTWTRLLRQAERRSIEISITKECAYALFLSQNRTCALSGMPIAFDKRAGKNNTGVNTASLDRILSSVGYVEGNLQWVHKDINMMKHVMSTNRFIELCSLVAQHAVQHNTTEEIIDDQEL